MAMDFPNAPSVGQVFGSYSWDGEKWNQIAYSPLVSPAGRLTLVSGVPVPLTNSTAINTIYWTPYLGAQFPFYDGTSWRTTMLSQISALSTDTTKSPAAIGTNKVNDWFIWDDAGTTRLSHGPDWTSDTVRSAGTVLTMVNGIYMNSVSITNGPAANRGVFVGTTRSSASSLFLFYYGSNAVGGSDGKFWVWNMYNRVNFGSRVVDDTATWTYAVNTPRMLNNSVQNRISFVTGLAEDSILASFKLRVQIGASAAASSCGMTLDGTGSIDYISYNQGNSGDQFGADVTAVILPQLGSHFIQATENADASLTVTHVGGGQYESLFAQLRM